MGKENQSLRANLIQAHQDNQKLLDKIRELEQALDVKTQEAKRMESMFAEYSQWRKKLEEIEVKMKKEVQYHKDQAQ